MTSIHPNEADRRETTTLDSIRGKATCSVQDAAHILGVSRWAVYRAIERGEISSMRIGRRILIPTARLLADLEAPTDS
jgi:excisionase family DNA binding protein